jgi:hypothetical protein
MRQQPAPKAPVPKQPAAPLFDAKFVAAVLTMDHLSRLRKNWRLVDERELLQEIKLDQTKWSPEVFLTRKRATKSGLRADYMARLTTAFPMVPQLLEVLSCFFFSLFFFLLFWQRYELLLYSCDNAKYAPKKLCTKMSLFFFSFFYWRCLIVDYRWEGEIFLLQEEQ